MFKIENKTIHITRGDVAIIGVSIKDDDGNDYIFTNGDIVRLTVYKNRSCSTVVLKKDSEAVEGTTNVDIDLLSDDTRIGDLINKPVTYCYEIVLNPDTKPQTIIGYDEEGAKEFILYPEAGDVKND